MTKALQITDCLSQLDIPRPWSLRSMVRISDFIDYIHATKATPVGSGGQMLVWAIGSYVLKVSRCGTMGMSVYEAHIGISADVPVHAVRWVREVEGCMVVLQDRGISRHNTRPPKIWQTPDGRRWRQIDDGDYNHVDGKWFDLGCVEDVVVR